MNALVTFGAGIVVGMTYILALDEVYEFGRRFRQRRADRKQGQS